MNIDKHSQLGHTINAKIRQKWPNLKLQNILLTSWEIQFVQTIQNNAKKDEKDKILTKFPRTSIGRVK